MRCSWQDGQGQQAHPEGEPLTLPLSGLGLSLHLSGPVSQLYSGPGLGLTSLFRDGSEDKAWRAEFS